MLDVRYSAPSATFSQVCGNIKNGKHFGATNSHTGFHSGCPLPCFPIILYTLFFFFGSLLGRQCLGKKGGIPKRVESWVELSSVELCGVEVKWSEVECRAKRKQGGAISKFTAWNYETLNKSVLRKKESKKKGKKKYIYKEYSYNILKHRASQVPAS